MHMKRDLAILLSVAVMAGIISGVVVNRFFPMEESAVTQPPPHSLESIRAEKFELVDKTGTRRAVLALEPNGEPGLKLYDATGSLRVALSLRPDGGPHLLLWDGRTAVPRFGLALLPNGSPSAELADRNGVLRVVFGLGTNGEPALGLFDQKGNLHPALGSATGEKPTR